MYAPLRWLPENENANFIASTSQLTLNICDLLPAISLSISILFLFVAEYESTLEKNVLVHDPLERWNSYENFVDMADGDALSEGILNSGNHRIAYLCNDCCFYAPFNFA